MWNKQRARCLCSERPQRGWFVGGGTKGSSPACVRIEADLSATAGQDL